MSPRTVRVPDPMAPLFERAEAIVSTYFHERTDAPERGAIEIFGERYVLVRAASLSVEFFSLVEELYGEGREQEAIDFTRNILFDLSHAIGKADAKSFHAKMGLEDPIARLSAGPVHFAHTGWAFVDLHEASTPESGDDYFLIYDHPHSFEADAWLTSGRQAPFPVCVMNSGYSSGWCQESFGTELAATEVLCRARGDDHCRFLMAPPHLLEERVRAYVESEPGLARRARDYEIPDFFSRKRLEDELRKARDELEVRVEARTRELSEANRRLQHEMAERSRMEEQLLQSRKLEALGRLTGGIAHDFNNLLTVIRGFSEMALQDLQESEGDLAGYLGQIRRAAESASEVTSQLLAFSRQQVVRPRTLDLDSQVADLVGMLERLIGEDVDLDLVRSGAPVCVRVDPGQVEQIVVNLAVNARDAMPRGGTMSIGVASLSMDEACARRLGAVAGPKVVLTVSDTGQGMDAETVSRVFEPFFTTKGLGRGTGLGLATVYGIVEQAGGVVDVESAPGVGTTFRVYFPHVDGPPEARPEPSPQASVNGRARTILLVEDEGSVREMVRRVLERAGFRVVSAPDPTSALERFEELGGRVDLLLSDVVMPGMSGGDLARDLQVRSPGIRTLFMSGYTDDVIQRELLDQGVGFIQKPFTIGDLKARVEETLAA